MIKWKIAIISDYSGVYKEDNSMIQITTKQNVGDIVAKMPRASEIFREYRIDFCCSGNRPLGEAIKEQNLDEKQIIDKLESMRVITFKELGVIDYMSLTPIALIEYIESSHHVYLRETLPNIMALLTKIMEVHGLNHNELYEVHRLFNTLKTELEQHIAKEEQILFKAIRTYGYNKNEENLKAVVDLLADIEEEHEGAGDLLKAIRKATNDYLLPKDACRTYVATYNQLEALEEDTFQHVHLENNILFKGLKEGRYT